MISQKQIKLGGIDNDTALQLMDSESYLNLMNGRIGISQDGKNNRIENIRGTTALVNQKYPPYGLSNCIGSCVDVEGQRLVWFIANTFNDNGIYVYDLRAKEIYAVVYDSQVTGGLGFDKNHRIDRNCRVINGVLYWTDNNVEPKKINLDKGIKANQSGYVTTKTAYSIPIAYTTLTVIRRPPYYALDASKSYDAGFSNNFIATQAFQMCYYYDFIDDEISRLSAFSTLLNYNKTADTFNLIICRVPLSEYIDDDIQRINICAKNLDTNIISVVKTFDKANAADLTLINAHNAGTSQLTFDFYNNISGNPLSASEENVPFDLVPLKTKTLEVATNRLMMGNNLSGYDTPQKTSLATSFTYIDTSSLDLVCNIRSYHIATRNIHDNTLSTETIYYLYTGSQITHVYFYNANKYTSPSSWAATVNLTAATYILNNEIDLLYWYTANYSPNDTNYRWEGAYFGNPTYTYITNFSNVVSIINDSTTALQFSIFKVASSYNVSIEFLDRYRRKCGVVATTINVSIPQKNYSTVSFVNYIVWTLSNTDALNEIPDWAYFYQITITKSGTFQSFLECIFQDASYPTKDDNGVYDFTVTVYDASKTAAVAVDISNLTANSLGYVYNEGDFATIYKNDNTVYTLPVIGQSGNNVLLRTKDIGVITNSFKWNAQPILINHVNYTLPLSLNALYSQTGFTVQSAQFADLGAPALDNINWIIQVTDGAAHTFNLNGQINLKPTASYPTDYMQITVVLAGFGYSDILIDLATQSGAAAGTTYNLSFSTSITIPAGYTKMMIIYRSSRGEIMPNLMTGYVTISRPTDFNLIQLYTPHKPAEAQEPFYECTPVYAITNPATNTRQYSTLTGNINGDTYILLRKIFGSTTLFPNEAMSPNDLYWKKWNTDTGWVNYIIQLGQTRNEHEIRYSNTYTSGTRNNGLSTFEVLNFKTLPLGIGTIQKIQLASKTEEQGVIMLAIGSFQTVSCYLGEVQLVGASKNSAIVQDTSVIGTINVLKGMFGTTAPETVVEYLGLVFWYDLNNGAIVQYSTNGLEAVSHYKMASFFQKYARAYLDASPNNLDNINGFHHIPTSINPFTKRLEITLPALIYPNYAATLPSYSSVPSYASSIINWFDPYTELAQTVCFDIIGNRWKETMQYIPEWTDYFENIVFAWKNGAIYTLETNSSTWNTFFGVQYPLRFCFTPNMPLSAIKDVFGIAIEGDTIPDFSVLLSDYPWIQLTDLSSADYENVEGVQYAYWLRDRLSPSVSGTFDEKLYTGDVIKGATVKIMIEFQSYNSIISINFVNVLFAESYGQKQLLQK